MCINESQTHELPMSEPVNDRLRSSGPTIMNKDIVQLVLVRVVHNEGDSCGKGTRLRRRSTRKGTSQPNIARCIHKGQIHDIIGYGRT